MTRILFFHNAPDRLQAAAAWLARTAAAHQRATVFAPDRDLADRLDRLLWTHPATGFVPHCRAGSPLASETPILITDHLGNPAQDECLLNLSDETPSDFSRFEELVEIVSTADADRLPARDRYRYYRDRGYELKNQDISAGL